MTQPSDDFFSTPSSESGWHLIPVKYNDKVVGYAQDKEKTIIFDNSEEAKLLLQSLDINVLISSRGVGKVSEDGCVIEREIKSIDISDLKK